MVESVMDSIIATGRVERGWLGVSMQPLTDELAASFGLQDTHGALVVDVLPDGPAAQAGLRPGDIVRTVNGTAVEDTRDLLNAVSNTAPGAIAKLDLVRDGADRTVSVTLGTRPGRAESVAVAPRNGAAPEPEAGRNLGLRIGSITGDVARRLNLDSADGVVVMAVDRNGAAAVAGLRAGDVILQVNGVAIRSIDDFRTALSARPEPHGLRLLVQRDGARQFVVVKAG
jgi:serine protease Do